VIAHSDAKAAGNPPHNEGQNEGLPAEEEKRAESAEMKPNHDGSDAPIYGLMKRAVVLDTSAEAHKYRPNSITKGFASAVQ